jgi:hypothetical protein
MAMTTKAPRVRARSISSLRRAADAAGYASACAPDDLEASSSASSAARLASAAATFVLAAGVALVLMW